MVVGNGRIALAFDSRMRIRDFYYPQVGLENHVYGHEFRDGIWVDGKFKWLGEDENADIRYMQETLVARCRSQQQAFEIMLETNEAVHNSHDVFLRKVVVQNTGRSDKKVRLFFSHDFHIYGDTTGDTVMYDSTHNSIIHYKRRRYFLIDGLTSQNKGLYQFATGYKESFGREGTWKDAEDGVLSSNPIAQGSVDSTVSFELDILPGSHEILYYWIACGKNLSDVRELDLMVKRTGVEQLLLETENYWSAWVNRKGFGPNILPREIIRLFKTSLLVMRTHADSQGGIIASCDSDILQFNRDTYSYVWPRDGSIAAMAFDLAGFRDVPRRFFQFCDQAITKDGFFHHKYSPDGSVGSSWLAPDTIRAPLSIEEDETAMVLYALWRHYQNYGDVEFIQGVSQNLIIKIAKFLLDHIDPQTGLPNPSYDLWEEKAGCFTWTAATVYAAMMAAANFAKVFYNREGQKILTEAAADLKQAMLKHLYDPKEHRFIRAIYADGSRDMVVDSSVSAIFMFGLFDASDRVVEETMNSIMASLWVNTAVGGIARYEGDEYHRVSKNLPGNPWFISTLWMARWHIARAVSEDQLNKGLELLAWVVKHSLSSGILAEQLDPFTGDALSVSPLIWSHAEFVIAVCEYLKKRQELLLIEGAMGQRGG
jgi:GH15 family glucan-1,4-alpha-glucosidase